MNLILLRKTDFSDETIAVIKGRQFEHAATVIGAETDDTLKIGLLGGRTGTARVIEKTNDSIKLDTLFFKDPPAPLPLKLVIAVPRPKVLKRILVCASSMGVKEIYLMRTWRVEKSYLLSPALEKDVIDEQLILGLEQAGDTIMPKVELKKLFKPFIMDELPEIIKGTMPLAAHPGSEDKCPHSLNRPATLVIGPEGGFIPYEIETLKKIGCIPVSIGERILRVEHAIPSIIGRLFT